MNHYYDFRREGDDLLVCTDGCVVQTISLDRVYNLCVDVNHKKSTYCLNIQYTIQSAILTNKIILGNLEGAAKLLKKVEDIRKEYLKEKHASYGNWTLFVLLCLVLYFFYHFFKKKW